MRDVTISQYTNDTGVVRYSTLSSGCAVQREQDRYEDAAEFARALYHGMRPRNGPKQLCHWNGDTGTLTVLDEVP